MEAIWDKDKNASGEAYVVPLEQMDEFAEAMFRAGIDAAIEALEDYADPTPISELILALKNLDIKIYADG